MGRREGSPTVRRMHDDLDVGIESLDELEGVAPPIFRRVLTAGNDAMALRDATALAAELAGRGQKVTLRDAADLIAIGSAEDGPSGRLQLGPAGRSLLEGARCPVAVAPRDFAAEGSHEIRRIDVGIDGSRESGEALALAVRIARAHDARLRLIAVAEPAFDLGGSPRPADPRELERLARHLEHATDGMPGLWIEADLREGLAGQVLVGLTGEADLLVLGSRAAYGDRGHVSLGEVATHVLRSAACPTLLAPTP